MRLITWGETPGWYSAALLALTESTGAGSRNPSVQIRAVPTMLGLALFGIAVIVVAIPPC